MATVVFPLQQLCDAADSVVDALRTQRVETARKLGVLLLQRIQLAYIDKARGGTGDDGITWAPIKVGTILARLRRAGHLTSTRDMSQKLPASQEKFRRTTYTVKGTKQNKNNAELFKQLAAAGVVFVNKKGTKVADGSRHKQGTILKVNSKVRKTQVAFAPGAYEIGRDTGLQLNSAGPGYIGSDGKGGNIFERDEVSFTVGFGRSYSTHFDAHRKLIPETMPDDWQKELEEMAEQEGVKIVEDVYKNKGVS